MAVPVDGCCGAPPPRRDRSGGQDGCLCAEGCVFQCGFWTRSIETRAWGAWAATACMSVRASVACMSWIDRPTHLKIYILVHNTGQQPHAPFPPPPAPCHAWLHQWTRWRGTAPHRPLPPGASGSRWGSAWRMRWWAGSSRSTRCSTPSPSRPGSRSRSVYRVCVHVCVHYIPGIRMPISTCIHPLHHK